MIWTQRIVAHNHWCFVVTGFKHNNHISWMTWEMWIPTPSDEVRQNSSMPELLCFSDEGRLVTQGYLSGKSQPWTFLSSYSSAIPCSYRTQKIADQINLELDIRFQYRNSALSINNLFIKHDHALTKPLHVPAVEPLGRIFRSMALHGLHPVGSGHQAGPWTLCVSKLTNFFLKKKNQS